MEEERFKYSDKVYQHPFKHSFGRWWLMNNGIHFFRGEERIYGDIPEIPKEHARLLWGDMKIKPKVYVGELEKSSHIYSIKDYDSNIHLRFNFHITPE